MTMSQGQLALMTCALALMTLGINIIFPSSIAVALTASSFAAAGYNLGSWVERQ
jgi:hypothetical protein